MHLRFDLLFEHYFAALQDFLNMRAQLARLRINDREFLFNTESKRVLLRAHGGAGMFLKNNSLSSPSPTGSEPLPLQDLLLIVAALRELAERTSRDCGLQKFAP